MVCKVGGKHLLSGEYDIGFFDSGVISFELEVVVSLSVPFCK